MQQGLLHDRGHRLGPGSAQQSSERTRTQRLIVRRQQASEARPDCLRVEVGHQAQRAIPQLQIGVLDQLEQEVM